MRVNLFFPFISRFGERYSYSNSYSGYLDYYMAGLRIKIYHSLLFGHKIRRFSVTMQNNGDIEAYSSFDISRAIGMFEEFNWQIKSTSGKAAVSPELRFNAKKGLYSIEGNQVELTRVELKYYAAYSSIGASFNSPVSAFTSKASTFLKVSGEVTKFDYVSRPWQTPSNESYYFRAEIPSAVTWEISETSPAWHFTLNVEGQTKIFYFPDSAYFKNSRVVVLTPLFPEIPHLVFSPNSITKPASNIVQGEIQTSVDFREDYPLKSPEVKVTTIPTVEEEEVSFLYNYGGFSTYNNVIYTKLVFPLLPFDKCLKSFRPFELIECPKASLHKKLSARIAFLLTYYTIAGPKSLPAVTAKLYKKEEAFLLHIPYEENLSFPPFVYLDEVEPLSFSQLKKLYEPFVEKLNPDTVYLLGGIEGYAGITALPGRKDYYTFKAYVMASEPIEGYSQYEGEIGGFKVWSRTLSYDRVSWTMTSFDSFFTESPSSQVAVLVPFTKA
jgi:hypothetical protein